MVLALTLAGCSSMPAAGTGTKDDPVLMVVTGEFTEAKMTEVLAEINGAKKYVSLDLSPMTGDVFDLEFLNKNGQEYIVSLKLPGAAKSIAGFYGDYFDGVFISFHLFSSLTSVTIPDSVTSISWAAFAGCSSLASVKFEGTIASGWFNTDRSFPGDLRYKYLAEGIGTYTRPSGSNTWTKQ